MENQQQEEKKEIEINLNSQIESILFYIGEPIKIIRLAKLLNKTAEEISNSLDDLQIKLEGRGIQLSKKDDEVVLVTNSVMSPLIKSLKKEELSKDLSKAALETLSIILYRGPIKRAEIDYIRGVNSQFILRLLLIRGLIEKVTNPEDERGFMYKVNFELLNHLGLNKIEDIPEYNNVNESIDKFIESSNNDEE